MSVPSDVPFVEPPKGQRLITIRASSLPQGMTCAPSILNPEGWPQVENEVPAAELGTLLHEFCERIVTTGEYDVNEIKAKFADDVDRALMIVSNFFTVWNEAKQVITKPQVELAHDAVLVETGELKIVLTGHIDLCQIEPNSAFILDYKTGRSHENHYHQIAGYAFLLWDYAGRPEVFDVKVAVVYLEDNTVQNYTFTAASLRKWNLDVIAKVKDPRFVVSRKCGYCRIASSCPTHQADRADTMNYLAAPEAQKGAVRWMDLDPTERGVLIDKLYVVKKGMEKVEISLRSAMQGKKDVNRLDIGKGMVYERVNREERTLDVAAALPLLKERFDPEHIESIVTIKLDDVLDLVASFAPRGNKGKARDEFFAKLEAAGAIIVKTQERFQRRPADEVKFKKE